MSHTPVGMGAQDRAERERFENEVKRIVDAGSAAGVNLRLLGSLAFQTHCPHYGYLQAKMGRAYTDIDFAGYAQGIEGRPRPDGWPGLSRRTARSSSSPKAAGRSSRIAARTAC